jgi:hypothetical protein
VLIIGRQLIIVHTGITRNVIATMVLSSRLLAKNWNRLEPDSFRSELSNY